MALLLGWGISACAGPGGARRAPAREQPADLVWVRPGLRQEGLASFYANSLAGRRTASGERYDPDRLTAAHRELPFGTTVRLQRVDGAGRPFGASVEVRINDRGPYSGKRILDLSLAAARRLDMVRVGVARVRLEVVAPPPPRR